MDKRVEIHGTARAEMNGKRGVAVDYHNMAAGPDESAYRYTIQLDSGESFKVKPERVRAESLAQIAPLLDRRVENNGGPAVFRGVAIDFYPAGTFCPSVEFRFYGYIEEDDDGNELVKDAMEEDTYLVQLDKGCVLAICCFTCNL